MTSRAPRAVPAGGINTSQDFYVVAYSFAPPDGPIATANGYHPLCDPCLFPGPPVPAYRLASSDPRLAAIGISFASAAITCAIVAGARPVIFR